MLKKKQAAYALIVFFLAFYQPVPAHASFFLFNIIRGIFGGGSHHHKSPPQPHTTIVKFGMQNSQVAAIQKDLIQAGYLSGHPDGIFGYQTLAAVKEFQDDTGLETDGIVGPRTLDALKNFRGKRPPRKVLPPDQPTYQSPPEDSGIPHYLYSLPVLATAYTAHDEGCTGITYRGHVLERGMIAVDPDVIPLGTKLYVPGYGEAVADDIGGAIIGRHIDLAMETTDEAFNWGRRNITVYVLSKG
ncbi:Hypothetical protein LUCI_4389 [Lucifera butyrica]|uniref:3D domain-containing protein n=1 Tax=Lucifera butyrica TaxID=1351585 RepID=A0A498RG83_9FIRM|nr:3D domain-containing protein [Lucifera butyrica]VBB09103.1 Hypothetical protein LUCI_4389 [Lucifera butyrica]